MGTNSIRNNITKEDIISSIRAELSADLQQKIVIAIVEGEDDIKILRKLLHQDVVLLESYSGKSGILDIISEQTIRSKRVIGIRDRDYCQEELHTRIFYYDYCCLEMMLIQSDSTFYNVCSEYYNEENDYLELRSRILKQLCSYSLLRKKNEEYTLGIDFKGIGFGDLFDYETETLNISALYDKINSRNETAYEVLEDDNFNVPEKLLVITNGMIFKKYFPYYVLKVEKKESMKRQ